MKQISTCANNMIFDAVVLGNGEFPSAKIVLDILKSAKYLCCCDGAAVDCISRGYKPDAIVGDGDSLPENFIEAYRDIIHIENEQEDNDLTKATRFCKSLGFRRIAYIGATGKREDHTLGNISLIERYMSEFDLYPVMFTDYGYFVPSSGSKTFETFPRQQISIFNFTCNKIIGSGFRWNTYPYRSLWQGTLNEATGDSVTLDTDGTYLCYFTYEAKNTP